MFSGIVYNQGLVKSIKKNPRYVRGSLVIEITSNISFKKSDMLKFRNFGKKSLSELDELISEKGLTFGFYIEKYNLDNE